MLQRSLLGWKREEPPRAQENLEAEASPLLEAILAYLERTR